MRMQLNSVQPADGAKHNSKRVGRGIGSGVGKTCGRGQKGQRARGKISIGFEGGQTPLHRRVPKTGFGSWKTRVTAEVRLHELAKVDAEVIDIDALYKADIIKNLVKFVKVIATGSIEKAVVLKGIKVTAGARAAIEAAGGRIEE